MPETTTAGLLVFRYVCQNMPDAVVWERKALGTQREEQCCSARHTAVSTAVCRPADTLSTGWHDACILAPQGVSTGGWVGYPVDYGVPRRASVRAYGRLHVEARTRVWATWSSCCQHMMRDAPAPCSVVKARMPVCSWSTSPALARIAHAFLLPFPLLIHRLWCPFLETPLSPIVLLLFVHLSLVIYPWPVRGLVIGLWVHVYARVWKVIRRRWIDITPSDRAQYPEPQTEQDSPYHHR